MKYAFILFLIMLLLGGFAAGDTARAPEAADTPRPSVTALPPNAENTAAPTPSPVPTATPVPYRLAFAEDGAWEGLSGARFLTALGDVHYSGKTAIPGSELLYASVCVSDEFQSGTPLLFTFSTTDADSPARMQAAVVAALLVLDDGTARLSPSTAFICDGYLLVCFPAELRDGAALTLDGLTVRLDAAKTEAP